jgi:trypsin
MLLVVRLLALAALTLAVAAAPASALVGGVPTQRNLPHMVAMEYSDDGGRSWSFRCGGSLVAPDVVLTAAHCVSGDESNGEPDTFPAGNFRFLAGTKKRSRGGERIGAVEVREHPSYDGDSAGGHDVALVKLASATTLGKAIRLARTEEAPSYAPGRDSLITGWGRNAFQVGGTSDDLEEITVPIRSDAECAATSVYEYDPSTMLCAGNTQGGEDSCQGDSGGPLMVTAPGGGLVLVGAVSFGVGCAFPTQYGIYAELVSPAIRSFVDNGIAQMSSAGGAGAASSIDGNAPAPAPGTAPAPGSGTAPAPSAPPSLTPPARPQIVLPARLGSARRALRSRRLRVLVRATTRLRSVRITLRRGRRLVATGRASSLSGRRRITLRVRPGLRRGAATLRLTARRPDGSRVSVSRRVTLTR